MEQKAARSSSSSSTSIEEGVVGVSMFCYVLRIRSMLALMTKEIRERKDE
jgi:hypothetical protein